MTDTQPTSSLEVAKAYIYAIDFSQIIDRMVKKDKWKQKEALAACALYRNFLFLKKKYALEIVPSDDIDQFWHNHILDTKKYKQDCDKIFGCYFDHYPYLGMDGITTEADAMKLFEKTQELYHQEFGSYIYFVRSHRFKRLVRFFKLLIGLEKSSD